MGRLIKKRKLGGTQKNKYDLHVYTNDKPKKPSTPKPNTTMGRRPPNKPKPRATPPQVDKKKKFVFTNLGNIKYTKHFQSLECLCLNQNPETPFLKIKQYLEEKYRDALYYDNYLILLGYNITTMRLADVRKQYPEKTIVLYQLEQLYNNQSLWYNPNSDLEVVRHRTNKVRGWLNGVDLIWDYDLDNIDFLNKEGFSNISFKPFTYAPILKRLNNHHNKPIDILFYGSVSERRAAIINQIAGQYNIKVVCGGTDALDKYGLSHLKISNKTFGSKMDEYIDSAKVILNLHFYDSKIQEQVRLFDLITNNKCVLSEDSRINYFGDLIVEFSTIDELHEKLDWLVNNHGWVEFNNIGEQFKNMKN